MTGDHQGSGDELWDEFVREIEKGGAIHEPTAAERLAVLDEAEPTRRRYWAPVAALCVAVVLAGIGYEVGPGRQSSTRPGLTATTTATTTATATAHGPASASPPPSSVGPSATTPSVSIRPTTKPTP